MAQLLHLEAENPEKPIFMYINSPGGSVTAGLAIYDSMQVPVYGGYWGRGADSIRLPVIYHVIHHNLKSIVHPTSSHDIMHGISLQHGFSIIDRWRQRYIMYGQPLAPSAP